MDFAVSPSRSSSALILSTAALPSAVPLRFLTRTWVWAQLPLQSLPLLRAQVSWRRFETEPGTAFLPFSGAVGVDGAHRVADVGIVSPCTGALGTPWHEALRAPTSTRRRSTRSRTDSAWPDRSSRTAARCRPTMTTKKTMSRSNRTTPPTRGAARSARRCHRAFELPPPEVLNNVRHQRDEQPGADQRQHRRAARRRGVGSRDHSPASRRPSGPFWSAQSGVSRQRAWITIMAARTNRSSSLSTRLSRTVMTSVHAGGWTVW